MLKVSAEKIKDNIIRYGLPEDATDDVKEWGITFQAVL
jgi:hypothetical protein